MKLISMIAASVLSSSLALGAAPDMLQAPSKKPMAQPSSQTPPQSYVPNMTRMPTSYLEATILYNQNGKAVFVDTGGQALPLSQASNPRDAAATKTQIPPKPSGTKKPTDLLNHSLTQQDPKAVQLLVKRMQQAASQAMAERQKAMFQRQSAPDPTISHWLTPVSPMTSDAIH